MTYIKVVYPEKHESTLLFNGILYYYNITPQFFFHPIAVQVTISDDGTVPSVGQSYTLICNVTANTSTYTWRKDNEVLVGKRERLLTLPSLNLSSAGEYFCEVTVASTPYRSEIKPIYLHSEYNIIAKKEKTQVGVYE